ncbi:MAG TPA: DEAD/DEAH box helicase, partial [Alphaproteobacteria bacterium]|nr:DEAD/DEAH box helicase [Alphaproteobacteria bacterium]
LMFSATMAPEIRKLAEKFLQNPREVSVAPPAQTAALITQELYYVDARKKRELLRHLLRSKEVHNAYIFCNRKRDVTVLTDSLRRHKFNVGELHGDMVQSKRYETLADFKSGKLEMMVCSDVAARGLDIPDVACVVNFDIPFNSEDYVHRIGRTGRAGKTGISISFATPDDVKLLDNVFTLTKHKVEPTSVPGLTLDSLDAGDAPRERSSGRSDRGGRGDSRGKKPSAPPPREREREKPSASPPRDKTGALPPRTYPTPDPIPAGGFDDDIPAFLRR